MSLKAFHVFFISVSILLTIGLGVWCARAYAVSSTSQDLVITVVSFVGAVGLAVYGVWFLRKLRGVGYL